MIIINLISNVVFYVSIFVVILSLFICLFVSWIVAVNSKVALGIIIPIPFIIFGAMLATFTPSQKVNVKYQITNVSSGKYTVNNSAIQPLNLKDISIKRSKSNNSYLVVSKPKHKFFINNQNLNERQKTMYLNKADFSKAQK